MRYYHGVLSSLTYSLRDIKKCFRSYSIRTECLRSHSSQRFTNIESGELYFECFALWNLQKFLNF